MKGSIRLKIFRTSALAILSTIALVGIPALSPAQDGQEALFNALVEPGETMRLSVGVFPDGTGGTMRNLLDSEGNLMRLEIPGLVRLRTPRIDLDCEYLLFEPESNQLVARGNVLVTQEQVRATGQELVYNLETGAVVVTGAPEVLQQSEESSAEFTGMETLRINPGEEGRMQVLMTGGERIVGLMSGMAANGGDTTTGSAPSGGMSGLGDDVRITTRPKGSEPAHVLLNMAEQGEFELFRAEGNVLLESTQMNLRSDQFEYNGIDQSIEALYNVFIRQDRVTAEAGRMVYDLVKDEITLTVDPEIREERGPGTVARIFDIASYVITRNPDGSVTTESFAYPNKDSQMVYESVETTTPSTNNGPVDDEPREIHLDDGESLNNL
ncbi:MAG: hypothetical protein JJU11_04205 [Candidatus Sumerlaeia bacterium]|nr:hypothetical protein [Candidatus Sumerlaeia bacterium]